MPLDFKLKANISVPKGPGGGGGEWLILQDLHNFQPESLICKESP